MTVYGVVSSRARGGLAVPSTVGQRGTAARAGGRAFSLRDSRPGGVEWTALPSPVPMRVQFSCGVLMGFRWGFNGGVSKTINVSKYKAA